MASGMQQPAAQHEAAKPQRGAVLHSQRKSPIVYVISGVSGSGKRYLTADACLPPSAKMACRLNLLFARCCAAQSAGCWQDACNAHSMKGMITTVSKLEVRCLASTKLMLPWHVRFENFRPQLGYLHNLAYILAACMLCKNYQILTGMLPLLLQTRCTVAPPSPMRIGALGCMRWRP